MTPNNTPPALRLYRVFADHIDRAYKEVEAESPKRAHEIASDQPEWWESCFEHAGGTDYWISGDVQDVATEVYHQVAGATHCKTCRSEIVETVNGSSFDDGECGPCEYARYRSARSLRARCEELVNAAEAVVGTWERGDLASAVQNLARVATETKSFPPDAHGNAA